MDDVKTRRALILAAGIFAIVGATSTLVAACAERHAHADLAGKAAVAPLRPR
jgi:hypothetical protein